MANVTQNSTPAANLAPSTIRTTVKHDPVTGRDYIFAYNPNVASPSVTAQFSLSTPPSVIRVYGERINGETRTIPASANFSDTFGPFEAHVYEITY